MKETNSVFQLVKQGVSLFISISLIFLMASMSVPSLHADSHNREEASSTEKQKEHHHHLCPHHAHHAQNAEEESSEEPESEHHCSGCHLFHFIKSLSLKTVIFSQNFFKPSYEQFEYIENNQFIVSNTLILKEYSQGPPSQII